MSVLELLSYVWGVDGVWMPLPTRPQRYCDLTSLVSFSFFFPFFLFLSLFSSLSLFFLLFISRLLFSSFLFFLFLCCTFLCPYSFFIDSPLLSCHICRTLGLACRIVLLLFYQESAALNCCIELPRVKISKLK